MNLNHFCDPEANIYLQQEWPIHDECRGKAIIDFGLETELIVRCDCSCHHWGWTDITFRKEKV